MATLRERTEAVDDWYNPIVPMLRANLPLQWNSTWTHSAPPPDGPGVLARGLADEARPGLGSWVDKGLHVYFPGSGTTPITWRVRIDWYFHHRSGGYGWIIIVQFEHEGEIWQRFRASGDRAGEWPGHWHVTSLGDSVED